MSSGLVAPQGSPQYDGGRDRLHIVSYVVKLSTCYTMFSDISSLPFPSEPEAAAVHSSLWKELNVNPNQSFMVCDAGGGTVVRLLPDTVFPCTADQESLDRIQRFTEF
jgi:hypothetical protein